MTPRLQAELAARADPGWKTSRIAACTYSLVLQDVKLFLEVPNYCNFAYSAFAAMRMGMSESASFHSARKS